LAVLPFHSLSKSENDKLLTFGLADTVVARISGATSLKVTSLPSSHAMAAPDQDPLDVARQLGAAYVLVGTTQSLDQQIRVNVRLLAVEDGGIVWSDTFDAQADGLFTLQDAIAEAVASALATTLPPSPSLRRSPCETAGSEANRAYLTGRFLLERPSGPRMRQAIASFQRALELDPICALAHARLAFAYRALSMTGDQDPAKMFPLAKAAVARALELDPLLAEAHSSQGFIRFWYDWDWRGSEAAFRRALELNPSLAEAHSGFAHLLSNLGRNEEAVLHARQAIELEPLSPMVNTLAASFLATAGHAEEAGALNRKARELDPDFWVAILTARVKLQTPADHSARLADLRRARELCGDCSQVLSVLGQTYAAAGDREAAASLLEEMKRRRLTGYVPATSLATVSNAMGDTETALDWLEQGLRERDIRMTFLRIDSRWDNLREQPRFQSLERSMAFDGAAAAVGLAQKE
jgi:serine/threonine-protein kinase